jgi:transcriptional regulator with XRE-family HTH domain
MFYLEHMSEPEQASGATVPEWTIGDRMRKAREHAGLSQSQLARTASIGRTSIVRYETGLSRPSRVTLAAWALRTGVSFEWMCHGDTYPCGPLPSPQARGKVYKMQRKLPGNGPVNQAG